MRLKQISIDKVCVVYRKAAWSKAVEETKVWQGWQVCGGRLQSEAKVSRSMPVRSMPVGSTSLGVPVCVLQRRGNVYTGDIILVTVYNESNNGSGVLWKLYIAFCWSRHYLMQIYCLV